MSDSNFDKIFSILKKNSDEYIENNKNEDTKFSNNKNNKEIEVETILPENKDIIEQEVMKPQKIIQEEIMKPQELKKNNITKNDKIKEEVMIPNSEDSDNEYLYVTFEKQLQSLMDQIIQYVSKINKDGIKVKLLDTNINEYTEDKLKECFHEKNDFSIYGKIQYNDNIENFEDIINDKTLLDFKF